MFGTYQRLNLHVLASDLDVIRAIRKKMKKRLRMSHNPNIKLMRKQLYRAMLTEHHNAQALYNHVMKG